MLEGAELERLRKSDCPWRIFPSRTFCSFHAIFSSIAASRHHSQGVVDEAVSRCYMLSEMFQSHRLVVFQLWVGNQCGNLRKPERVKGAVIVDE